MKKILSLLCTAILLWSVCFAAALPLFAAEPDVDRPSSLQITYRYGEKNYAGLEICTYRIAELQSDYSFVLTGDFADYPVSIYGISSQAEWRKITETLAAYIVADAIAPTATLTTDDAGTVKFTDLMPGIYLTAGVRNEQEDGEVTVFETFLTVIPLIKEEGYLYDVEAYPKCEQYIPGGKEIDYKVVKQWKDGGKGETRTESVRIDLYKDADFVETVILSDENNWVYSWTAIDDGAVWTAVEREIPKDYNVTVTAEGTTFVVTNTYDDPDTPPPVTGDSTSAGLYIGLMCISGLVLILLSVGGKRMRNEKT